MKAMIVVVALAACSKKPSPPDAKAFAAMTLEQKCDATFPRAKTCINELMIAEVRSLGPDVGELGDVMEKDIGDTPTYKDEAEAIHKQSCFGSRDDEYPRGIVRCWDVDGCKAFADCVFKAEPGAKPAPVKVDEPPARDGSAGSGSAHHKVELVE